MSVEMKTILDDQQVIVTGKETAVLAREKALQEIYQRVGLLNSDDWDEFSERICIFGGRPNPIFLKYRAAVQSFITENNMSPVGPVSAAKQLSAAGPVSAVDQVRSLRYLINGGRFLDLQHIHFDKEVYVLDVKQAEALNNILLKEFNVSLENAGTVAF